jgi:protein transport protein SEC24
MEHAISSTDSFAIQTALLYTNSNGERRIRVHNFMIPLTSDVNEIYNGIDSSALTVIIRKEKIFFY